MFFSKKNVQKIVVGLGNPGKKYNNTRHNIGFCAVDSIANSLGVNILKSKFDALYAITDFGGQKILLLKPQTFMNLSGQSVSKAINYYKLNNKDVIVIYDDVSLEVGKLRIREQGSAGGHNGIKSIIDYLGQNFARVKVGVGDKPHAEYDMADWVLSSFTQSEKKLIHARFDDIRHAVKLIIEDNTKEAQSKYNG